MITKPCPACGKGGRSSAQWAVGVCPPSCPTKPTSRLGSQRRRRASTGHDHWRRCRWALGRRRSCARAHLLEALLHALLALWGRRSYDLLLGRQHAERFARARPCRWQFASAGHRDVPRISASSGLRHLRLAHRLARRAFRVFCSRAAWHFWAAPQLRALRLGRLETPRGAARRIRGRARCPAWRALGPGNLGPVLLLWLPGRKPAGPGRGWAGAAPHGVPVGGQEQRPLPPGSG
jgi:hypothetical protein